MYEVKGGADKNMMNILDEIEELRKEIKRLEQEVAQAYNDGYSDGWNNAMEDCDNRN
jgi:archaellum component FlaC